MEEEGTRAMSVSTDPAVYEDGMILPPPAYDMNLARRYL